MKNWVKVVAFLVIPIAGFLLLLGGVFTDKIKAGEQLTKPIVVKNVKTLEIKSNNYAIGMSVSGTVVAKEDTTVSSKIMAAVKQIVVKKGMHVKQGDPLIWLDPTQAQAVAKQVKTGIDIATANQKSTEQSIDLSVSSVGQAQSNVKQALTVLADAQARYELTKKNTERITNLYNNQAVSKQEYDDAITNLITAKAAVDKAKANVDYANATLQQSKSAVEVAKSKLGETNAQIEQSVASLESANVSLQDTVVRAPFDGIVVDTLVNLGDMASPGLPMVKMEKSPYFLEADLDERKQSDIRLGELILVNIDSIKRPFTGSIAEITPHVDPTTRKFRVKISLPSSADIVSGMFGQALFSDGGEKSVFVPDSAIVRWTQFTGVYVVDNQQIAHLRFVNLGRTQNQMVEVLSGLDPGEKIVLSPIDKVVDKAKVVEQQ